MAVRAFDAVLYLDQDHEQDHGQGQDQDQTEAAAPTASLLPALLTDLATLAALDDLTAMTAALTDLLSKARRLDAIEQASLLREIRRLLGKRSPSLAEMRATLKPARPEQRSGHDEPEHRQSLDIPDLVAVAADENGAPVYLLLHGPAGLRTATQVEHHDGDDVVILAPPVQLPWKLPRAAAIIEQATALAAGRLTPHDVLDRVLAWCQRASELRHPTDYLLVALFVLLTYVIEQVNYCPILLLEAEPERGKTRTGKAITYVSRHGVHVPGLREANLLRDAQDRQATLFLDLKDLWAKAEKQGCEDILLSRFERGMLVPRVLWPDRGPHEDTTYYRVFGPTLIATNEPIHRILDTRCVRLDMPLSARTFPDLAPADALPVVELLTAWRAVMLRQHLAPCDKVPGRLGDILKPLQQVLMAVAPERAGEFATIVAGQDRRRKEEKAGSTEAAIVRAINASAAQTMQAEDKHWLRLAVVLDSLNTTRPAERQLTAKWLGGKIRGLGFTVERVGHGNSTALAWEPALLARLLAQYGLVAPPDDRQTQPAATPTADVSHVSPTSPTSGEECDTSAPEPLPAADVSRNVSHQAAAPPSGEHDAATGATRATHTTDPTDTPDARYAVMPKLLEVYEP